uniref:Gag-Pol polyprotein n=1 Tax=Schistocephalus solidus TaxID=70667 RepID=A0A183T873_SCHSO
LVPSHVRCESTQAYSTVNIPTAATTVKRQRQSVMARQSRPSRLFYITYKSSSFRFPVNTGAEFNADIRYVRGSDNVVADALPRPDINTLSPNFDLAKLGDFQLEDESIADLCTSNTLQLLDSLIPAS